MKKIIIAFALSLFTIASVFSQGTSTIMYSLDSGKTTPYVLNTDSVTMVVKVGSSWDNLSIQLIETKATGTVAGTAVLVGSNDGRNFVDISRPSIAATSLRPAYKDTLTSTNITTNTKLWVISNATGTDGSTPYSPPYLWYGIRKTGSGTMLSTIKAYVTARHK